jgi:DNA-binding GntR family transcriptional regulator
MAPLVVTPAVSPPPGEAVRLRPQAGGGPLAGLSVDARQLDEQIYDSLRQKILLRELPPGSHLSTRHLADQLGVSVTPVRDALRRLQADGLVQIRGRGETTVTRLTPQDVDDIFDLRLALERHAAQRSALRVSALQLDHLRELVAAMGRTFKGDHYLDYPALIRLDGEFHHALIAAARNPRLAAAHRSLAAHVQIARVYYTRRRRPRATHAEHRAILTAHERRDPGAAAEAVHAHVENTRRHILQLLHDDPDGGSPNGATQP